MLCSVVWLISVVMFMVGCVCFMVFMYVEKVGYVNVLVGFSRFIGLGGLFLSVVGDVLML